MWLGEYFRRLGFRFRNAEFDRDLQEEMRLHVDLRSAEHQDDGLAPDAARRTAALRFGNLTHYTESSREAWGWVWLDRLAQDLRYGVRTLAANPGFAATAVLSLALGIGANTAIFSIINGLLLRSLPVPDPQRLVQIVEEGGNPELSNPIWEEFRDRQQGFAGTLAFDTTRFDLSTGGESRFADGLWVSGDYFHVLGVPAERGRVFTTNDDRHGGGTSGPVAVISHRFWQSHFHGDPEIVGKTVQLNRQTFQIVGVTPAWFTGLHADKTYDVAVPVGCMTVVLPGVDILTSRQSWWIHVWARLAPGEARSVAEERLRALAPEVMRATTPARQDAERTAAYQRKPLLMEDAGQGISTTGRQYRTALFTLLSIVGLVLLIACANIANLLLARASARRRELSVRLAVGAGRGRIVRQLMTESVLLAMLGTSAGWVLAYWGGPLLVGLLSSTGEPVHVDLSPDLRTLAFTGGVAILTALLFGLIPALRATRVSASYALAADARGSHHEIGRSHLGRALVAGQIALSLVLLVGAGLFVGTLRNLLTADTGFNRRGILLVSAYARETAVPKVAQRRVHREIGERIAGLPGAVSVSASYLPPIGRAGWNAPTYPEGFVPESRHDADVFLNRVSPGYFATMRAPLLAGREFTDRDELNAPKAIVINETVARSFFGKGNPIGKTIGMDRPGHRGERDSYEVIGLVKDAKYNRVNEAPRKIAYLAIAQDPNTSPSREYEVRTAGPVEDAIPAIRKAVADVNRDVMLQFRNLDTQVKESLLEPRLVALLSAVFGGLALVLAMVGLYGITAYGVARRTSEIGIRMALGAQGRSVVWLMLREVLALLAIGTVLGLGASLAGGRYVVSLLYGLKADDPWQLAGAASLLTAAALIAAYLPARRASRIDPMSALRDE
jgi:predicted permease